MKTYRMIFHAKRGTVAVLMCIGFVALAGEAEDLAGVFLQLLTFGISWLSALYLFNKWGLGKIENRIKNARK